jgi:cytochrome c-type biogenesis protein CcmH/NrfG
MKTIVIAAVLCFSLLAGCGKADVKKAPTVPVASEQNEQSEQSRPPHYAGLIAEYRAVLTEEPDNLVALTALGNAYYDSGEWKKAIVQYEHALRIDSRNADVRTDCGTAYRNLGFINRAMDEYRLALQYDPAHVNARYNMGIVYAYDRKDLKEAIRVWEELLRLAPNHPQADSIRSSIATFKEQVKKEAR